MPVTRQKVRERLMTDLTSARPRPETRGVTNGLLSLTYPVNTSTGNASRWESVTQSHDDTEQNVNICTKTSQGIPKPFLK